MVFAGLYPVEGSKYAELREALEKLRLNDASFFFEPETSAALGFGFRCGFLGLLHMEIVQERLEREFDQDLITTAPGVLYRVTTTDGVVHGDRQPVEAAGDRAASTKIEEPIITAMILTPSEYVGGILELCQEKRGIQKGLEYVSKRPRAHHLRAAVQRGRARLLRSAEDDLARLRVARLPRHRLLGIAAREARHPRQRASRSTRCRSSCTRTTPTPRGRALAVEDARADSAADVRGRDSGRDRQPHHRPRDRAARMRKNVLAKCYGGDITRKRKLLEKQKEGKKRMKRVGRVEIPQEAFLAVLKVGTRSDVMKKSVVREYFESLVIAVILALFVRTWVFQAFKIPTGSMEQNLLIGDHLIVNKMVFAPTLTALERALLPGRPIRRGDVVVFKYPEGARARLHQARDRPAGRPARAAPQDRSTSTASRSTSRTCSSSSRRRPTAPPHADDLREEYGPVTVPADQYFMMGDNRDNSRTAATGASCRRATSRAQALFIYFSLDENGVAVDSSGQARTRWGRLLKRVQLRRPAVLLGFDAVLPRARLIRTGLPTFERRSVQHARP